MSLNWNIGRIANFREVCYETMTREEVEAAGTTIEELLNRNSFMGGDWYTPGESEVEKLANCGTVERLNPLTNTLIWACMTVDLPGIAEENHVEFWLRIRLTEQLSGPFLHKRTEDGESWEPRHITLDEIKSHIGLGVNVSEMSWREWMTRSLDTVRAEMLRKAGVADHRGLPRDMKLSQIAKDTHDQMEAFQNALGDHHLSEDAAEGRLHDKDYGRVCKMMTWLGRSADDWESVEYRLESEEEE